MSATRLRLVFAVIGAALLLAAVAVGWHGRQAHVDLADYAGAPRCSGTAATDCWSRVPATVVETLDGHTANGPATHDVVVVAGGRRQTLQLSVRREWALLYPGQRVGIVRYGGYAIGLDAGGALYVTDDYPANRRIYAVVFAAMLLGLGLGLLVFARWGLSAERSWVKAPLRVWAAEAALMVPVTVGALGWIGLRPTVAEPAYSRSLDCARPPARPLAGMCETSIQQFAAALAPGAGEAAIGPSCTTIGGVWRRGLTPAGVARALRGAGIGGRLATSSRYAWLAGPGALRYAVSSNVRPVPTTGVFVIGVYPTARAAHRAWSAMGMLPGLAERLLPLSLEAGASYQSVNQADNLVFFTLYRSGRHSTAATDAVVRAELGCAPPRAE